jgi:hypothetical protein
MSAYCYCGICVIASRTLIGRSVAEVMLQQISRDTPGPCIMDLPSKTDRCALTVPFLPQQVREGRGNGRVAPPESFAARVSSLLQHACMCVCG